MTLQPAFDGETYDPQRDHARLTGQLSRVKAYLADGGWHTLAEIADAAGGSEAGASARIRDLRKAKFGGYDVARRNVAGGIWEYRWVRG